MLRINESARLTDTPPWQHAEQSLTIAVSDTTLAIELDDAETRVVCRTTTPVCNIKADRPWTVPSVS
jgi:hypothetical protein